MDVDSLRALLEQRFDAQDRMLNRIEAQVTRTNGRVSVLETQMAGVGPRLDGHDREFHEIKHPKPAPPALVERTEGGEERVLRVWMLAGAIGIIVSTLAVLGFFGMLKTPTNHDDVRITPPAVVR